MWLNQCTKYCRMIVLIFIIALCAYVMYYNSAHIKEKFVAEAEPKAIKVEQADKESRELVEKSFRKLLKREPEPFELNIYIPIVQKSKDNIELERRIKETAEYMYIQERNKTDLLAQGFDKVQAEELEQTDFDERMNAYKIVMAAFDKILERLPNNKELNYFAYRLMKEEGFDQDKLEQALMATEEYSILEKMQDNQVYGELPGNITEAQIKLELHEVYESTIGKPDIPHQLEEFLLGKFKEYHLDKVKLRKLIMTIEYIDDDSEVSVVRRITRRSRDIVNEEEPLPATDGEPPLDGRDAYAHVNASYELVHSSIDDLERRIAQQREEKERRGKNTSEMGALFKDDVVQFVKSADGACKKKPLVERDHVAEYAMNRNIEALRFTCMRDTYYDYMDDEYETMYPDYKALAEQRKKMQDPVTEILPVLASTQLSGTILDSAKKTGVGSILPKFIYKEY